MKLDNLLYHYIYTITVFLDGFWMSSWLLQNELITQILTLFDRALSVRTRSAVCAMRMFDWLSSAPSWRQLGDQDGKMYEALGFCQETW